MRRQYINLKELFKEIENAVVSHFELKEDEIFKKTKLDRIVYPRQMYFYLCKTKSKATFQRVVDSSRGFSNNHANVIYAVGTIEDLLYSDKEVRKDLQQILEALKPVTPKYNDNKT